MLFLSAKFLLALALVRVAVAVPLGIEYDKTTGLTAEEQANKGRLDTATTQAHVQVTKMREGFTKYKAGDAKAKALYEASFGKNADANEVDNAIKQLETGKIKAKVATHPFTAGEIAAVPWTKNGNQPWTAGDAQFSKQFHGSGKNKLNDAGRAGTIIHEATHQLSKTGDDVNKSGKIIRPNDGSSKPSGNTGYTSNHNFHKTVAEVNADTSFTAVRDSAPNMHHNAESYAIFGSLCSQPGALRRRDLHLFSRALAEGDDDQLMYLARQKKATAAKAGAKPGHLSKTPSAKAGASRIKGGRIAKASVTRAKSGHLPKAGTHSKVAVKGAARTGRSSKVASSARGAHALAHVKGAKAPLGVKAKAGARPSKLRATAKGGRVAHTAKTSRRARLPVSRSSVKGSKPKTRASHATTRSRVTKKAAIVPIKAKSNTNKAALPVTRPKKH
ncbi:hypothetical protein BDN70DRAFT_214221 [Pholiota conissans]|uniref:Lysine-specific metallo-endopeptidase domain-containing protein n=1 Tax=Pholiota conissans TaxID=109636 RepID=A0A9P6CYD6_9AGAR|nr:hypothetical protein BDN70DRAFT_214221 [Pholiota conissans]